MISVIIASASKILLEEVKKNVAATIGIPYELLAIDNTDGGKGICEIYNEGANKARFDVLCFMHEDISLLTKDWGRIVLKIFNENPKVGVIGIAGATYKSVTPSGWLCKYFSDSERSNLIQSFKYLDQENMHQYRNPLAEELATVATVDGVWMCVRKDVAVQFPFDKETFKRFHCYDLDFCISAGRSVGIAVTYKVLLHHHSDGNFNAEWMTELLKLHEKWADVLPTSVEPISLSKRDSVEKQNFKFFLRQLFSLGFSPAVAYNLIWKNGYSRKFSVKRLLKFHYYILKYYLKRK